MKVRAIKSFLITTMAMTFLVSMGQGSILTKANTIFILYMFIQIT